MTTLTGIYPSAKMCAELNSLDFAAEFHAQYILSSQLRIGGQALFCKVRDQVLISGPFQAARNLRKQGYSIEVALALIAGRI